MELLMLGTTIVKRGYRGESYKYGFQGINPI
jgi:hypothetical protein